MRRDRLDGRRVHATDCRCGVIRAVRSPTMKRPPSVDDFSMLAFGLGFHFAHQRLPVGRRHRFGIEAHATGFIASKRLPRYRPEEYRYRGPPCSWIQ